MDIARPSNVVARLAGPGAATTTLVNGAQSPGLHTSTWDGTNVKLYVNAVLDSSPMTHTTPLGTDSRAEYIGGRIGNTDFFDGFRNQKITRAMTMISTGMPMTGCSIVNQSRNRTSR